MLGGLNEERRGTERGRDGLQPITYPLGEHSFGANLRDCPSRNAVDYGTIDHWMVLVFRSEITVRVVCYDRHAGTRCPESMNRLPGDNEYRSCRQWVFTLGGEAKP